MTTFNSDNFDTTSFTTDGYTKRVEKPWGHEIHWVPEGMPYMGKVLHIEAGKRLSLQAHDPKQETYWLLSGDCDLIIENKNGEMETVRLEKGKGYTTMVGQRHRHQAVTDCDVLEVSTPEAGLTWRLEDDYARPDETEEQRKKERGE
ncbi:MAG: cupin [Candidatus Levybacteria bacterium]|nr:cupin [Candidatus Levybacteria bacterium]